MVELYLLRHLQLPRVRLVEMVTHRARSAVFESPLAEGLSLAFNAARALRLVHQEGKRIPLGMLGDCYLCSTLTFYRFLLSSESNHEIGCGARRVSPML